MQRLRQDPAARYRSGTAHRQPPKLIGLEQLQVADVVNFAAVGSQRLRAAPGNFQIVGLLLVRVIARRDIAADDQGEVVRTEKIPEVGDVNAFFDEDLLFD